MINEVISHYEDSKPYILEQYKSAEKWNLLLKAYLDKLDYVENYIWNIAHITDLIGAFGSIPSGGKLDFIGNLVGTERITNESDSDYYLRIMSVIEVHNSGTIEGILQRVKIITGDDSPRYQEENIDGRFCAGGVIVTHTQRQLKRSEANSIKVAGTHLFIGGYLLFGNAVIATKEGIPIVFVGGPFDTITIETSNYLTDESSDSYLIDEFSELQILDEV